MSNLRTYTAVSKGKFKCFHCRNLCPSKDGSWQVGPDQQVFLCNGCSKAPRTASSKKSLVASLH